MKCLTVSKLLIALSLCLPLAQSFAQIDRTQLGVYDLATQQSHIYNMNLTPTPLGATVTLTKPDDGSTQLSAFITSCRSQIAGDRSKGYIKIDQNKQNESDAVLDSFVNYVKSNNLRVTFASLSASRQVLLMEDNISLLVDEKTIPRSSHDKCQNP
ncbi:hypothetical protein MUA03_01710 [Enterobacteriaceae bacterium H16N7]|nr:hypothetical protein [Dryocola clanedunensis]